MSDENVEILKGKIEELQSKIEELSRDDVYGMWTRAAFLQFCQVMPRGRRTILFLDFDGIHNLNKEIGYKEVDRKIRSTFTIPFRTSDIVARWYSGDEIVILFDGEGEGVQRKITELVEKANENGLSFTYEVGHWEVGKSDVITAVDDLSNKNRAKRKKA